MIEKCPACEKEVDILLYQPSEPQSTTGTFAMSTITTFSDVSYSPTSKIYKCSNPECWVTKIKLSWE